MNRREFVGKGSFSVLAVICGALRSVGQNATSERHLSYHSGPPTRALPDTLDPHRFKDDRRAFVAYSLAGRVKPVLYQVPCYCSCNEEYGHESLLDCFVGLHGSHCSICQKEAIFSYMNAADHKSPSYIRSRLAKGELAHFDLDAQVKNFYALANGS